MQIFTVFPLLTIPVIIYNIMALSDRALGDVVSLRERLNENIINIDMTSGVVWTITPGHLLICLGLLTLFFELLKSTGVGRSAIINHAFSMVLFIVCLVEFLMIDTFATSVFFLLTLMCLLDVMAGFIVTLSAARRDIGFVNGGGGE